MNPNSMTGYARVQGQDGGLAWVWEIKTVNARGLEIRTRLPSGFDALDLPLRDAVQKSLKRGSVGVGLTVTRATASTGYMVNEALLGQYAEVARRFVSQENGALLPPSIDGLMALKGVIEAADAESSPDVGDAGRLAMLANFAEALAATVSMRCAEGKRLADMLGAQIGEIETLVAEAAKLAVADTAALAEKLRAQVTALMEANPPLSEDRLLQEVALLATKADVREEIDRLTSHIAAARDMLDKAEPVGRRLDFLCQEFNREANTLCSKASSVDLTRVGMDLKAVIEQFREQVQNIE